MHKLGVDIGEPFEIRLVYVRDDQLIRRREDGLSSGEELVEILGSFATLWRGKQKEVSEGPE